MLEGTTRGGASAFTSPSNRIRLIGIESVSTEADDGAAVIKMELSGADSSVRERTLRADGG
jgi:hypothetical protein